MGVPVFKAAGDEADPAVLLVHGYPQSSHMWRPALRALAAHPGLSATGLMRTGHAGTRGVRILDAAFLAMGQPPEMGALPLLMAATADLPGSTYVGPRGPGQTRGLPTVVGTRRLARDHAVARRLWEVSQDATGVAYP